MTTNSSVNDVCYVALELSKSAWVCAFAPPESGRASVHKMRASDVDRLLSILETGRARAMRLVSLAGDRALLRSGIRRILARTIAHGPRHPHHRFRAGELSQTAPGSACQDRSA